MVKSDIFKRKLLLVCLIITAAFCILSLNDIFIANDSKINTGKIKEYRKYDISFIKNRNCSFDTLIFMKSYKIIQVSECELKPNNLKVNLEFISNCCFNYRPAYTVQNKILKIVLKEGNKVACGCKCCHNYKLEISNIKSSYEDFEISFN